MQWIPKATRQVPSIARVNFSQLALKFATPSTSPDHKPDHNPDNNPGQKSDLKIIFGATLWVPAGLVLAISTAAHATSIETATVSRANVSGASIASSGASDFTRIAKLVKLPDPVKIGSDGKLVVDKSKWLSSKEADGTELLTSKIKEPAEARIAVIRSQTTSNIESFTAYSLKGAGIISGTKQESSASVFFDNGKLKAFTICEDSGSKDSIGRTCVTATPRLCENLKKSDPIEADTLKAVDTFEMRAIATILTLRGADHQLDNVVRTGNRLGLKSSLQTTKGQLMAFSKQIAQDIAAQEAEKSTQVAAQSAIQVEGAKREPANVPKKISTSISTSLTNRNEEKKIVVSANTSHAAVEEEAKIRTQLDHTIPMLQQACADTGFAAK